MNYEKKTVWRNKETVDFEYNTLESAIEMLNRLVSEYGKDAKLAMSCYDYDDKECLFVQVLELETDREFRDRVEREERQQKWKEEYERKVFEELSKKFGK